MCVCEHTGWARQGERRKAWVCCWHPKPAPTPYEEQKEDVERLKSAHVSVILISLTLSQGAWRPENVVTSKLRNAEILILRLRAQENCSDLLRDVLAILLRNLLQT